MTHDPQTREDHEREAAKYDLSRKAIKVLMAFAGEMDPTEEEITVVWEKHQALRRKYAN